MNKRRILLAATIVLTSGLAHAADGTWTSTTSANWNVGTSWDSGIIADGPDSTAFFNTINPTGDVTVTLGADRTIGNLIFGDTDTTSAAGWTVTGNTLTLAGTTPTITVNPLGTGKGATISSIIAGGSGLVKSGTGTLTLTGANTYTGTTTVSNGTLQITTNNTAVTSGYTLNDANTGANGTTLRFAGGFTSNRSGVGGTVLRDSAPITVANLGTGTTVLDIDSSSSAWINTTAVLNKAVTLRSTGGGGVRAGFVTFSGPGAGAGNDTIIYDATGSGNDANWNTYENVGTYVMQPNTYTGNVRFTGGTTTIQNKSYANAAYTNMMIPDTASVTIDSGATATVAWGSEAFDALNGAGTLNVNSANATITIGSSNGSGAFSGVLANGGSALSLTKTGSGTQLLSGGNTYTGATNITGGTLVLTGGSLANTSSITVASGTNLWLTGGNNQLQAGATTPSLTVNGTLAVGSNSAHTLYATTINLNNGTIAGSINNTSGFGGIFLNASRTFTATGYNVLSGGGVIGINNASVALTLSPTNSSDIVNVVGTIIPIGTGSTSGFTKAGAGRVIFNGANTYIGATLVSAGTLELGRTGTLSSSTDVTVGAATLQVDVTSKTLKSLTVQNNATLALAATTGATTTVTNALAFSSNPTVSVQPQFSALPVAGNYDLVTAGSVSGTPTINTDFTAYGATRVAGSTAISGTKLVLTLTTGAANIVWNNSTADNTWNVDTTANFNNGGNDVFKSYDAVTFNSTVTPGTVTLSGTLAPSALTVSNTSGTYTFNGTGSIVGAGSLTKSNAGTLVLNAATNYLGSTTISGGTLELGTGGSLGNGDYNGLVTFSNNAVLNYTSSGNQTLRGTVSGAGSITQNGTGTLTIVPTGTTIQTGGTTINSGTVKLDLTNVTNASQLNYGTFNIGSNGTLELYNVNATSIAASALFAGTGTPKTVFTGSGTIIKSGPGAVDWWASNAGTSTSIKNFSGLIDIQGGMLSNQTVSDWDQTTAGVNKMDLNIAAGAYFDLRTASAVIDQLTGAGTVGSSFSAGMILTVGNNDGSSTFSGVFQNTVPGSSNSPTVGLTKVGTGSLTISGSAANTNTGVTTVSNGSLLLNKSGTATAVNGVLNIGSATNTAATVQYIGESSNMVGTGAVTINGRGQFDFNGKTDTIGNVAIVATGATTSGTTPITNTAGGGVLTIGTLGITPVAGFTSTINSGTGTLKLGGAVTFTPATTGQAAITGNLDLNAGQTFNIGLGTGAGFDLNIGAVVSNGTLTKSGTGRLQLSGANSYTGVTTVNAGTLAVTGSIANNGPLSVLMAAPDDSFSSGPANPILSRRVLAAASYTLGSATGQGSTAVSTDPITASALNTTAAIMAGTASSQTDVTMQWRTRTTAEAAGSNPNAVLSDVINLNGTGSDVFLLEMSYNDAALNALGLSENSIALSGELRLGWLNGSNWVTAIDGNSSGTPTFEGDSTSTSFLASLGASPLSSKLGSYGVDTVNNKVWAVLDHNSEFAVIPEPSTLVVGSVMALGLALAARRRRRTA